MKKKDFLPERRDIMANAFSLTAGALLCVSLLLAMDGAAAGIVRSSQKAFGIPDELTLITTPVEKTIDGKRYLQFIARREAASAGASTFNIIAGPVSALLDHTIPWSQVIYSQEPVWDVGEGSVLVDLDNDGEFELFDSVALLSLGASRRVLNDALVAIPLFLGPAIIDRARFMDIDGDGDLDLFGHASFQSGDACLENTGTPEAPIFDATGPSCLDLWNDANLPAGFLAGGPYSQVLSIDMDQDGDADLVRLTDYPSRLQYLENTGPGSRVRFVDPYDFLPFQPFPDTISGVNYIEPLDFDSDGDQDLVVDFVVGDGEIMLLEKQPGVPPRYARVRLTDMPEQIATHPVFLDVDGDGMQDFLTWANFRRIDEQGRVLDERKLILLTRMIDDSLRNTVLYTEPSYSSNIFLSVDQESMQAIDVDGDGDRDIAMRYQDGDQEGIYVFEQTGSWHFSPLQTLSKNAIPLRASVAPFYGGEVDLDGDGDLDRIDTQGSLRIILNHAREPGSVTSLSARSWVGGGDEVQIGGFIIEGDSPQTVIVRGLGPSLAAKGIVDALSDPELLLFSGSRLIAYNDDWHSAKQADAIASSDIAPSDPRESALRLRLNPGAYTVHLRGKGGSTGIGIFAVDRDQRMPTNSSLTSLASRALVRDGDNIVIGGFIVEGDTPSKVLIRGLGPSLREKGVPDPIGDPFIVVYDANGTPLLLNDDWRQRPEAEAIGKQAHAPSDEKEAAAILTLPPGAYTVHLRDRRGEAGIGIIAVDQL